MFSGAENTLSGGFISNAGDPIRSFSAAFPAGFLPLLYLRFMCCGKTDLR
jgi:hypothetical protein